MSPEEISSTSTPGKPLLRRGIIKNRSWRIRRPEYLSKYSNSNPVWMFILENKWCIGFFAIFLLGIIFSFLMRMALFAKPSSTRIEIPSREWYQEGVIYRIYIPSFADSDGNGIGDFGGIQSHLNYLKELGISILWLSPIQETNTYGYDVTDFVKTKDEFGYLEKFKSLLDSAKSLGMKVIMDIIINHSSRAHKWFQKSVGRQPLYADYYVWHNIPNNWMSVYNGSAWAYNEVRKEYYLHQFRSNEPDLNYQTHQVVLEMKNIVRFWLEQGIDGFYIRDLPFLYENKKFENESHSTANFGTPSDYLYYDHNKTRDLVESYEIIEDIFVAAIQETPDDKKIVLMSEFNLKTSEFNYTHQLLTSNSLYRLRPNFNGLQLKNAVEETLTGYQDTQIHPVWILGSEQTGRACSKFDRRAIGLQIVQLLLPGIKSIYYGEEIEMINHPSISFEDTKDPVAKDVGRLNYSQVSKDPFRTPMLWNASRNSGFTVADKPWLPITGTKTADSQMKKPTSLWNCIAALIKLRNSAAALQYGWVNFPHVDEKIFVINWMHMADQNGYLLVWNLSTSQEKFSLTGVLYLPDELVIIRKIKPDSCTESTHHVGKTDITIAGEEILIVSYRRLNFFI